MKNLNDNIISSQFTYKKVLYNKYENTNTGLIETYPVKKNEVDIYETGHYEVKPLFFIPILINLADMIITTFNLNLLKIFKNSNILDFGCGKGYFIYFLKKIGFKKLAAVETSISRANFSREISGVEVCSKFYSGGRILKKKYDCITLIHVLEHITNPFEFLNSLIDGAIENNGLIYIEVPNIDSFSSKIAGHNWAHFTPHFHTNHFSFKSLINYCVSNNLEYKVVGSFSFYNSAMGMTSAILSLFGYKGSIFEDLKKKKILVIIAFVFLIPFTLFVELFFSLLLRKGSVIKFAIKK
jgi:2-polyprenyl-3-methyl-5-hydroxy-6-metoxy-1,4-benzoquinol methylase